MHEEKYGLNIIFIENISLQWICYLTLITPICTIADYNVTTACFYAREKESLRDHLISIARVRLIFISIDKYAYIDKETYTIGIYMASDNLYQSHKRSVKIKWTRRNVNNGVNSTMASHTYWEYLLFSVISISSRFLDCVIVLVCGVRSQIQHHCHRHSFTGRTNSTMCLTKAVIFWKREKKMLFLAFPWTFIAPNTNMLAIQTYRVVPYSIH